MIGADAHPSAITPIGSQTYVNEQHAADALAKMGIAASSITVSADLFTVSSQSSLICLGSSRASRMTRLILGSPEQPRFDFLGRDFRADFEYAIGTLQGVVIRQQDHIELRTDRRSIVSSLNDPPPPPAVKGTELHSDLLLLTRLPRSLTSDTDTVVLAGVHGPAMRAVELFVKTMSLKHLREISDKAREPRWFQMVFRVSGLSETDGNVVASEIEPLFDTFRKVKVNPM